MLDDRLLSFINFHDSGVKLPTPTTHKLHLCSRGVVLDLLEPYRISRHCNRVGILQQRHHSAD